MSGAPEYSPYSALFTDLYELTMCQAYAAEGLDQTAVFELFFRLMPEERNYMVAAGLPDVLNYLERLHVTADELAYLGQLDLFSTAFLEQLRHLRFTGDVYAVPEGTVVFPNEPLVQVVAPLQEAQLVETYLLNQLHFQTVAASKAARVVGAAGGKMVVEFGARRAHGTDAALKVSRASYLVGAAGTSNVLAGKLYDLPVFGTMAHSYVQAHDCETEAFTAFAREFPATTLLVDTYDTLHGVQKVIDLSRQLGDRFRVQAIRLDSGDLGDLARQARQMLDTAGLTGVMIFASSNLDEYQLEALVHSGAPIDAFGVGTRLATVADATHIDLAYKLVEFQDRPRMKLSSTRMKATYPGRKQFFRQLDANGRLHRDVLGRFDEVLSGTPLLQPVMKGGQRLAAGMVGLKDARRHALDGLQQLPPALRSLQRAERPYMVEISPGLQTERNRLERRLRGLDDQEAK